MTPETFCSLPFTEIFLGPNGGIKPCCSSRAEIGSLHKNTIEEILDSDEAKDMRNAVLNGRWHKNCEQCRVQESQGVRSERDSNMQQFIELHPAVDSSYFKLTRLDLRWSNTCNLSCTYCFDYFSSKWASIKGVKINNVKDENLNGLMLLIEREKNSINHVLMLGGEPLLQKQNQHLIDSLTGKKFYILTNFAVPFRSNLIAQKLLTENNVGWAVSFETVKDRFEYVRHGATWETFIDNIDYLAEIRPDIGLDAHALYSIYSAFNLVEFYKFLKEKNFKNVYWNMLYHTGINNSSCVLDLPIDLRQEAIAEIKLCQSLFPDGPGIENLDSIKQALLDSISNIDNAKELFLKEIFDLENMLVDKKLKFADLWPEVLEKLKC